MTRGREANHAYVVTESNQAAIDILTQAVGREWIDRPAISQAPTQQEPLTHEERNRAKEKDYLAESIRRTREQMEQQNPSRDRGLSM